MVGVYKNKFFFCDLRVKFLILKRFKKTWFSSFPWEIFLENDNKNLYFLFSQTQNNINTLMCETTPFYQLIQHTLLFLNYNSLFSYTDASCYKFSNTFVYITNFSCLYNNTRVFFLFKTPNKSHLNFFSSSFLFPASQWVERELRELFTLSFYNLNDSRKLLSDYTQFSPQHLLYKTNSYNLISQDLYF